MEGRAHHMSKKVRDYLAKDDEQLRDDPDALVEREVTSVRRKRAKSADSRASAHTRTDKRHSLHASAILSQLDAASPTTEWSQYETVKVWNDDTYDRRGHLLARHKQRRYVRRHRHTSAQDGDESEEEVQEDVYVTYPHQPHDQDSSVVHDSYSYEVRVTSFEGLPHWLRDNDFLRSGHRLPLPSVWSCMRSIFHLHTETGNIWTHLLGCLLFMSLAVAWWMSDSQYQEKIVLGIFLLGAVTCLLMSTMMHTLSCHATMASTFCKLDYVGITCLIVTSMIPWLYYGFYCRSEPKYFYMSLMIVMGAVGITISLSETFSKPALRPVRALVFIALGACGVVPCVHFWITDGFHKLRDEGSLATMLGQAALYVFGATLYALRIPERYFPGKFDIWFQSHQIFHVMVVLAAFVHYRGVVEMAANRLAAGDCAPAMQLKFDELYSQVTSETGHHSEL